MVRDRVERLFAGDHIWIDFCCPMLCLGATIGVELVGGNSALVRFTDVGDLGPISPKYFSTIGRMNSAKLKKPLGEEAISKLEKVAKNCGMQEQQEKKEKRKRRKRGKKGFLRLGVGLRKVLKTISKPSDDFDGSK